MTIRLGGKVWQKLRQGVLKSPDWGNQHTGLRSAEIWNHKFYSAMRRSLVVGTATARSADPAPGVEVHVVNLGKTETSPKQMLYYSSFQSLVAFRQPHVLLVELGYEEEIPPEVFTFVSTETESGEYPALLVLGEESTVKAAQEELEREGRSDLRVVHICQRWQRDEPPFGPSRPGERCARRVALLGGKLRKDIYPFTYLDDPKDIGQVEVLYFVRALCGPDGLADNEPVRVLYRPRPGRTSSEALVRCAFLSGALGDAYETVCLCDDPTGDPEGDIAESFDTSTNMASILERATQRLTLGRPTGVNMICDLMRAKEEEKTKEKPAALHSCPPAEAKANVRDSQERKETEKEKKVKKEKSKPVPIPDPEPAAVGSDAWWAEQMAQSQREKTALEAARRAGAGDVDTEDRRSQRARQQTDKYQVETVSSAASSGGPSPKTPKPRTKHCARSRPPSFSERCKKSIHGVPFMVCRLVSCISLAVTQRRCTTQPKTTVRNIHTCPALFSPALPHCF